jgi:hypothetical protein
MTINTIMAKARVKNKKSMRYEANWLLECLTLRIKSSKVYDHLFRSGILPLPHPNTLCSLLGEMSLAMPEEPRLVNMFSSFSQVTVSEVESLLDKCLSKFSLRDSIPTFLLKEFSDILVHPITNIINLSLSSGIFPDEMKLLFVIPLLKKSDLDPNKLCNYRPVSNLSFSSKLVERVCVKPIMSHPQSSNLLVPVQSAYGPDHSMKQRCFES